MGRVTDCDGKPLAGALLDVWSGDGDGKYDVQLAGRADDEGARALPHRRRGALLVLVDPARRTTRCPTTARSGEMMRVTDRSIYRPGHIHMQVSAPGHVPLTTHIFVAGSPYIDEDAVFGKRDSLVVDFDKHPPGKAVDGREMKVPYHSASFDFRLAPAAMKAAA